MGWQAEIVTAQSRYASSDSLKGYVHWIDLYDEDNQRIDPLENARPYSPEKTCGRCHDYKAIAHGWHFNGALAEASHPGRPGQPWVWSDPRTGTHLPLSLRGWPGTHQPRELGLTDWQIAAKFGGYLPGLTLDTSALTAADTTLRGDDSKFSLDRSRVTGNLPIDCMLCHHRPGSGYSPFVWSEQIAEQNFLYAPTAALGLGVVTGGMRRLRDDFDLTAEETRDQLPALQYDATRFRGDGKVFVDLVRRPTNDACYYCHSEIPATAPGGTRWLHDQDVHLRAGMLCVDCHRNGLDHHTVRGFESEQHPAGSLAASLSCQGCHVGSEPGESLLALPGRMGAPKPAHYGLPPLHFDKLSCTACHSGPMIESAVQRQLTSMIHRLGEHQKRKGDELPAVFGNVLLPVDALGQRLDGNQATGTLVPHRLLWPSYWALIAAGTLQPLNPEQAYEVLRKPLRVRRDFGEELSEVKLSLTQRREVLGDDRLARLKPEELNQEQRGLIESAEQAERQSQIEQRMVAALTEIESAFPGSQAVFISGGAGFVLGGDSPLAELSPEQLGKAAEPYAWPTAHAVRPARQALGAKGCQECHAPEALLFDAQVVPVGSLPGQVTVPLAAHQLQQADRLRLNSWNLLFAGRSAFKLVGWIALILTGLVVVSALAINLQQRYRQ